MRSRQVLKGTLMIAALTAAIIAARQFGPLFVAQSTSTPTVSSASSSGASDTCGDGIHQSNEICMAFNICDPAPGFICCPQDCNNSSSSSTPANCNDGIDNDGDGNIDGLQTAAVQRRSFATADAVRDAINALGGARVPGAVRSMEFGCGSNTFGATSDAGFCAGLGYDGFEAAVCSYSACGAGGNPKVEANAYWNGPQVIRDDCNTWYQKNNTTWHNYLSSVTCLDKAACGDGKDNDFDGKVDMQDTGCANADDDSEVQHDTSCDSGTSEGAVQVNECADGIDNDGDGKIDRTQTSSLSTRLFTSPGEIAAAINALGSARVPTPLQSMEFGCGTNALGGASDAGFCGLLGYGSKTSNCLYSACGAGGEPKVTGNGYISGTSVLREDCNGWYTHARTTWHNYLHAAECVTGTQCSDGIDNDGDGLIDHPADIGCASANDTSEVEADPECATGSTERATATSSSQNAQCQISYSGYCGAAGCPKALVGYQNKTYLRYETAAGSWQTARTACQAAGGDLVSVNTAGEQTAIFDGLVGDHHDLWIGLSDIDTEGTFRWTDGTSPTYTNWYPNQPDDGSSNEDCVEMNYMNYAKNGKWNDFRCSDGEGQNTGFICEIARNCGTSQPPASSRPAKYSLHTSPNLLSWCDAQQACAQLGQNLATITNETELNAAFTAAGNTENVWIGLNDAKTEGKYVWVSGEPFKSSHGFWTGGQPNGEGLPWNDCTMLNHGRSGKYWHDVGCDGEGFVKSYLCEDAVRSGTPPVIPGCDAASRILSCSAGGFTGPTVTALRGTPDQPLQLSLIEDFYGLQIAAGQGTTMTMAAPTGKEFKAFPMVAKLDGVSPTVRIRFVNPETGGRITVPGNTLRILVGRFDATASGTIIGKSYDFTGQLVEDLRLKSQQAFLTFTEWHIAEVELSATGLNSFYFNNMGYGPLECTPVTAAYVRPSSSSRTSSSRTSAPSSAPSSAPAPSSRSSAKSSDMTIASSLRSVMTSGRSSSKALSSLRATSTPPSTAPSTASQPAASATRSSKTAASAPRQSSHSSVRFSLPSINLPAGTSSLSNEQLRNILSLQFPEIPVDSFFPLPDGFWEGQENPDGVTLDLSQAGRAKSSSSAMSALAVSWLDEWLPWRAAAPEETSSASSSSPVAVSSEPEVDTAASSMAATTSAGVESSAQSAPRWQSSSTVLTPPSSDMQDKETTAPVTLSQDGMPLWWWVALIVGAILGLMLGMYVTNRLLTPKEE